MSKSNPKCQVQAVHSGEPDNALFDLCPLHCCTPLCFYFDHFVSHLCIILWPCIASLEKQSLWYLLHSVGTVDVNVCTLYSTFINTG